MIMMVDLEGVEEEEKEEGEVEEEKEEVGVEEEEEATESLILSGLGSCLKLAMTVARSVSSSFRFIPWVNVTIQCAMFVLRG